MTAANPFKAEVPLAIGDTTVDIRLTWSAVGSLVGLLGENWDSSLNAAFDSWDVETIAKVTSILTGMEAEDIIEASPPWVHVREAYNVAYHLFLLGVPDPAEASPEQQEASEDGPLAQNEPPRTFWSRAGMRRLKRAWTRSVSGRARSTRQPLSSAHEAAPS